LPIKVLQSNNRVAEVQLICDCCGKIVRNGLIAKEEADPKKKTKIICWQCKRKDKQ